MASYLSSALIWLFLVIHVSEQAVISINVNEASKYQDDEVEKLRKQVHEIRDRLTILDALTHSHVDKVALCSVGMKNGKVTNSQITASSVWSSNYVAAYGRLDNKASGSNGGVWAPHSSRRTVGEWLQVDMLKPVRVVGVVTQGRSNLNEWVTSYKIQYGNTVSTLQTIKDSNGNDKVFQGNTDRNSHVISSFPHPLVSRYFRLIVQSYHGQVSLRMDYVTC